MMGRYKNDFWEHEYLTSIVDLDLEPSQIFFWPYTVGTVPVTV